MPIIIALVLAFLLSGDVPPAHMPYAIGRITPVDQAGKRLGETVCTGTLVAPDLVLTAGHCLSKKPGAAHRFEANYHMGDTRASVVGRTIYRMTGRHEGRTKLQNDLALLQLETVIPNQVVRPLPILNTLLPHESVFYGYTKRSPETAPNAQTCLRLVLITPKTPYIAGLDCEVEGGNSGAPLLSFVDGEWHISAVLAAKGRKPIHAFAVLIPYPLLPENISKTGGWAGGAWTLQD